MAAYEGIESGAECERFAGVVEALALGSATASQVVEIRPHLRHCAACRAAVRDLHVSRLRHAPLLLPWVLETVPTIEERLRQIADPSIPLPAPDTVPAAPDVSMIPTGRFQQLWGVFHRAQASEAATTGAQIVASGGGGRLATVAAVLGLCLSGAGVGTVCVVSGLVTDPLGLLDPPKRPALRHHATARPTATPTAAPVVQMARPRPSATPLPTPAPHPDRQPAARAHDPAQGTTATSHQHAPISPAPSASSGQDTFTPESTGAAPPAPAPATGGAEFTP
jgi:hypothetical protein